MVRDLYDEFLRERRGPKTALAEMVLEIQFVFAKTLLVSDMNKHCFPINSYLVYGTR